jgi:hypothetical protein
MITLYGAFRYFPLMKIELFQVFATISAVAAADPQEIPMP